MAVAACGGDCLSLGGTLGDAGRVGRLGFFRSRVRVALGSVATRSSACDAMRYGMLSLRASNASLGVPQPAAVRLRPGSIP